MENRLVDCLRTLVCKLEAVTKLTANEEQTIQGLPAMTRGFQAGQAIALEGERPEFCALIASGWACRYKVTEAGSRQILSFHFAGDIPDLQSLLLPKLDHSLMALTSLEVAFLPHDRLNAVFEAHPRLARAFWRDTLVDASIYRQWLLCMGRLPALQQMAHLFCEIVARLDAVGLATIQRECIIPIPQTDLADALGMSAVHVNRTLQDLRSHGLISWNRGNFSVPDWAALSSFAEFDPAYLHLEPKRSSQLVPASQT